MSIKNLKIGEKGLMLVAVPLLFELVFVGTLAYTQHQSDKEIERQKLAKTITSEAERLLLDVIDSSTATTTYGLNIKLKPESAKKALDQFKSDQDNANRLFDKLSEHIHGEERSVKALRDLRELVDKFGTVGYRATELYGTPGKYELNAMQRNMFAFRSVSALSELLDKIREKTEEFSAPWMEDAEQSEKAQQNYETLRLCALSAGLLLNCLLAGWLVKYFSDDIASRLNVIDQNTKKLASGDALLPRVPGGDEIANVDRVFHDMAARLHEVDQMKKEFVGIISHELRTPLTSLQALLTVLEAGVLGELSEKTRKRIRGAEADVDRLIRLINELLDIEKMESGKLDMIFSECVLDEILDRSINSVRAFADQKEITITAEKTDEYFVADADRIVQVIINILSNAIKFSPAASTITISANPTIERIEVRITDQGRGIPAEELASVFDRFKQVELDDERTKGGSGLGLAICKAVIEQHGGKIGVQSDEGKGSTFWFTIPRGIEPTPRRKKTVAKATD